MKNDKFVALEGEMQLKQSSDMDCKGCIFAYSGRDIDCSQYIQKPLSIINGGTCSKKKKKKGGK